MKRYLTTLIEDIKHTRTRFKHNGKSGLLTFLKKIIIILIICLIILGPHAFPHFLTSPFGFSYNVNKDTVYEHNAMGGLAESYSIDIDDSYKQQRIAEKITELNNYYNFVISAFALYVITFLMERRQNKTRRNWSMNVLSLFLGLVILYIQQNILLRNLLVDWNIL
ncbi:hypothetical protein [Pontibacillus yanchengensis]|uniref:Uncharacterized protein n=1 Tax=Pontibacillus yanchengensis Y32 TaxID=1385514 RepID=A0A0A2T731_9BACI|nr:hypothetical protein [Pontibacillus yanchengensis]KGP71622.1 hypothetical protein N782_17880 [Pontibacillus yanchengensis Y32]